MTQVFISYSRTDMEFVQKLAKDLQGAGLDVWWDLTDIQGSDVWERKIEEGLRNCEYFIVVLTPASLDSRWVRREYLSADNRGIRIIPLRLKTHEEIPLTLRDIQPIEAIEREYEDVLYDVLRIVKGGDANVCLDKSSMIDPANKQHTIKSPIHKDKMLKIVYPKYDREKYTILALPHPEPLHWIINPGLAFNELILGQKRPKVILIDKTMDKPLFERQFVPCPHCGELHNMDGWGSWGQQRKFWNWFGFVCPVCGQIIPPLWNLTSLLILFVLTPIWVFTYSKWKNKWIEKERRRFNIDVRKDIYRTAENPWVVTGMGFGGMMFWFMVIPTYFTFRNFEYADLVFMLELLGTALGISIISGLLVGFGMSFFMGRRPKQRK